MNQMSAETLDSKLLKVNYDFGVIYQALVQIPHIPNLQMELPPPKEVIDFFERYTAKLARQKLGLSTEQPSYEEERQYQSYRTLVSSFENQMLYPHVYPIVRKQDQVYTDPETLSPFKKDFNGLGQSLDVVCVMTGAFIDSVTTSEYLRGLGKDINLVLLYHSAKIHSEDEIQVFDSERERMREEVPALIVEDIVGSTTTIGRVANYLTRQGYSQIFVFSPQTLKVDNGNFKLIRLGLSPEIEEKIKEGIDPETARGTLITIGAIPQLLEFKPPS
jgi:hypothetical protein